MATAEQLNTTFAGPVKPPVTKMEFPNLRSRIFLRGVFQRQFLIPEDPPVLLEAALRFVEKFILRPNVTDIPVDRPVFLLGLPRSGTTMLQDIIGTHPGLAYITSAMHQFRKCFCAAEMLRTRLGFDVKGERYLGDSVEVSGGSPNEGLRFWADWFGWSPINPRYSPRAPESFTAAEIDAIKTTLRKVIWCFGRPWRRFFSKNPAIIPDLPRLNYMFPEGKYIHIVRDPRSCANSMRKLYHLEQKQLEFIRSQKRHGVYDNAEFVPYPRVTKLPDYLQKWGPDSVRTTAHVWKDCVDVVQECKPKLKSFLEVRFEDILANPKKELARIFEFADLEPIRPENKEFWNKIDGVGKTHHKNTYGEFDVIEEICRDYLRLYNYN
jgi:hypothetical protein